MGKNNNSEQQEPTIMVCVKNGLIETALIDFFKSHNYPAGLPGNGFNPDVILSDPAMMGYVVTEICPAHPKTKVLVLDTGDIKQEQLRLFVALHRLHGFIPRQTSAESFFLMLNRMKNGRAAAIESKNASNTMEALTKREAEIFSFIGKGWTNKEIADQLSISLFTVKKHITNACTKLGTRNRFQLVALLQGIKGFRDPQPSPQKGSVT